MKAEKDSSLNVVKLRRCSRVSHLSGSQTFGRLLYWTLQVFSTQRKPRGAAPLWRNVCSLSSFWAGNLCSPTPDSHLSFLSVWRAPAETVRVFVPKDLTCDLSCYHRLRVSGTLKHTSLWWGGHRSSQPRPDGDADATLKLRCKICVTEIVVDRSHSSIITLLKDLYLDSKNKGLLLTSVTVVLFFLINAAKFRWHLPVLTTANPNLDKTERNS